MEALRQFLYLDQDLVRQFLAQLEGGVFEEDAQVTRSTGGGSVKGAVGAGPLRAGGERATERSEESSRVVRQTAASEFNRLMTSLKDSDSVQWLENIDDAIWRQLSRGEIVEIDAIIRPAGIGKIAEMFSTFEDLLPAMGAFTPDTLGEEEKGILSGIRALKEVGTKTTTAVIVSLSVAQKFQFACVLQNKYLLSDASVIEGESTVLGKIQRKLAEGERYVIPDVFAGLEAVLPEEDKTQMLKAFDDPQVRSLGIASPEITHPGGVLTPIAIYR